MNSTALAVPWSSIFTARVELLLQRHEPPPSQLSLWRILQLCSIVTHQALGRATFMLSKHEAGSAGTALTVHASA
jgi:hypothetical protein